MLQAKSNQSRATSVLNTNCATSKPGTPAPGDPGDPPTPALPIPLGILTAKKLLTSQKIIDTKDYITPSLITLALTRIVALPGVPLAATAFIHAIILLLPETLEPIVKTSQWLSAIETHLESPAIANASDPAKLTELVQKITKLGEQLDLVKASSDAAEAVNLETQKLVMAAHKQGGWEMVLPCRGACGPKSPTQVVTESHELVFLCLLIQLLHCPALVKNPQIHPELLKLRVVCPLPKE
ncbi:hypothetical protein FRC10_009465 [Ceratobasidium sp. 414]|nr:hypothetical protein FRC10_009465 [Ceratobasidium sp. 414]